MSKSPFPSKPRIGPNDKIVARGCRSESCDSTQAIVRKPTPNVTQFVCIQCGQVTGINQGGSINL